MMANEESTEIVNFMTPGVGDLLPGCGHKSHIVQMHYFSKTFSTFGMVQTNAMMCLLIPIVLTGYIAAFLSHYSMMGLLICKYQPF